MVACDRINLTIQRGESCAIMGQSGSGKSPLMNLIGGLDRPARGQYRLNGADVSKLAKNRLARIRNRNIGFIFQRYELLPNLTALEYAPPSGRSRPPAAPARVPHGS